MGSGQNAKGSQTFKMLTVVLERLGTWVEDRANWAAFVLTCLVAAHAVLGAVFVSAVDPYKSLALDANTGTAVTLYLGLAAAAAIVAGFAGVIIIFTIGSESDRVRQFRFQAGKALQRSWTMVVVEPFMATFLGVFAAVTQTTSGKVAAPWLFELGVVLLAHGSIRLVWLLRELIEIVYASDHDADSKGRTVAAADLFPQRGDGEA